MSENNQVVASEYLKRTCLICGCHTNLTINIYEPRSGPNIVQLIQAKFKFQPLNEDKYLCFSCNNWLINWHSLQAVNSNDAESASNMSNNQSVLQDAAARTPTVTHSIQLPNQMKPNKCRPVAHVRPLVSVAVAVAETAPPQTPATAVISDTPTVDTPTSNNTASYSKRRFRGTVATSLLRRCMNEHKMLRNCSICGCAIVLRVNGNVHAHKLNALKRSKQVQCRKCREISSWRAMQMRSFGNANPLMTHKAQHTRRGTYHAIKSNSSTRHQSNNNSQSSQNSQSSTYQRYQQPSVDGKVVAMFRRLGTTLSREPAASENGAPRVDAPRIMSPSKQRPRWTRNLEDDEILLEFDSAITEVLPEAYNGRENVLETTTARRRLSYDSAENEHVGVREALQQLNLPEGLSISLI